MEAAQQGTCRTLGRAMLLKNRNWLCLVGDQVDYVRCLPIGCASFSAFSCAYAIKVRPGESDWNIDLLALLLAEIG